MPTRGGSGPGEADRRERRDGGDRGPRGGVEPPVVPCGHDHDRTGRTDMGPERLDGPPPAIAAIGPASIRAKATCMEGTAAKRVVERVGRRAGGGEQ